MDRINFEGRFDCTFYKRGVLWCTDVIENTVQTEGKNVMLDAGLAGSAYTVVGPFMGMISLVGFTLIAVTDTAAQINGSNGWKEAGLSNAPTYTGNRQTCAWSAASGGTKTLSATLAFAFSGSGTVKGAFIVFGASASATKDTTTGKLWSAGLFAGGDKLVDNTTTLNVSYTVSS